MKTKCILTNCGSVGFSITTALFLVSIAGVAEAGTVSEVVPWTSIPIHASLTPDGRVMTFGAKPNDDQGGFDYVLWDPSKGNGPEARLQLPNGVNFNSFCVGGVIDPATGRVLLAGGAGDGGSPESASGGVAYDFASRRMVAGSPLAFPRYYASLTTLPDGRILVDGGSPPYGNQSNSSPIAEIYTPGSGWSKLPGTAGSPQKQGDPYATGNPFWYPHEFPIGFNRVFAVGGKYTYILNYSGNGSFSNVNTVTQSNWGASSTAVMYRPGIFMQIGGGTPGNNADNNSGSNAVTIYDLRATIADPAKQVTTSQSNMALKRHFATATVMANGEVLVTGGAEGNNSLINVANRVEVYNPNSGQWRLDAALTRPRLYHSIALLMKDGRVLTGGGGSPGPIAGHDIEIYTPDYLLDKNGRPATRPSIVDGPQAPLSLGQTFRITADKPIKRVTIVKTGTVTHSYNTDQRFFEAGFVANGNSADVIFPNDQVNATPGVYMVFAFDADGVPSVGKFVRLRSPLGDTGYTLPNDMPTPTTPTGTERPASGWAFCAHDGESCPVNGTQQVRFGANGGYKTLTVTNQATCTIDGFGGDPAPGIVKTCEILANSYGQLTTQDPSKPGTGTGGTGSTPGTPGTPNNPGTTPGTGTGTGGSSSSASSDAVQIVGQNSSMCMSAPSGNTKGQALYQATCDASDKRQLWNIKQVDGGANLVNVQNNLCMDVAGIAYNDGASIQQWDCYGGKNQVFKFDRSGAWTTLVAAHSLRCVDVFGWSKANGSSIVQWSCTGGANQQWSVKPVSGQGGSSGNPGTPNNPGTTPGTPPVTDQTKPVALGFKGVKIAAAADGTLVAIGADTTVWRYVSDNNWKTLQGNMKDIAVADAGHIYGVGVDGFVYQYRDTAPVRIGHSAVSIAAASDGTVAVTTTSNEIWVKKGADFQEAWVMLPKVKAATDIAIMNANSFWAVGTDRNLYRVTSGGQWSAVGNSVGEIATSSDGTVTVASAGSNQIWRKTGDDAVEIWRRLTTSGTAVATSNAKTLFSIAPDGQVYRGPITFAP